MCLAFLSKAVAERVVSFLELIVELDGAAELKYGALGLARIIERFAKQQVRFCLSLGVSRTNSSSRAAALS